VTLVWTPGYTTTFADADAQAYLTAVETADNQALEYPVAVAIDEFVRGCKADGIWSAIKASCILSGARTLAGALVPLAGTAPTNVGPFVSGDYNRKTGLAGDGSTKYLNSNRADNADLQNNRHIAAVSTTALQSGKEIYGARGGATSAYYAAPVIYLYDRTVTATATNNGIAGFYGSSRTTSTSAIGRTPSLSLTLPTSISAAPTSETILIFAGRDSSSNPRLFSNTRLAFYSIGESLDLALLDNRVSTLIAQFGAVIP
jgi:hypothetical protein